MTASDKKNEKEVTNEEVGKSSGGEPLKKTKDHGEKTDTATNINISDDPAEKKDKAEQDDPKVESKKGKGNKKGRRSSSKVPKTPGDKKRQSITGKGGGAANTGIPGASPTPAQDAHPYARGSVIEVLYIPATAVGQTLSSIQASSNNEDPWYWSEDSSLCSTTSSSSNEKDDDDDEEEEDGNKEEGGGSKKDVDMKDVDATPEDKLSDKKEASSSFSPKDKKHHHHHHHKNAASVRLADVIDRVPLTGVTTPTGQQAWRYYVHYCDFNRRMDEWVGKLLELELLLCCNL